MLWIPKSRATIYNCSRQVEEYEQTLNEQELNCLSCPDGHSERRVHSSESKILVPKIVSLQTIT